MSFRYHLTSLAAVLLALAVGIVVGTTSLSATPGPTPEKVVVTPSPVAAGSAELFVRRVQSRLLRGALTDHKVLLVLAPDAPADAPRPVVAALQQAGATVTGQLRLLPALLDTSGESTVEGVVTGVAPTGVTLPPTGTVARAGAELAAALVTSDQGTDAGPSAAQKVLGGFTGAQLIAADGPLPTSRADLVLLIAGPSRGVALATLATAFQARVGTVVAGPASAARGRGAVAVLRQQSAGVSDVDGLGTSQGLVAAVLALAEQASGGSGHYGTASGATAAVPDGG